MAQKKIIQLGNLYKRYPKRKRIVGLYFTKSFGRYKKGDIVVDPNQHESNLLKVCLHEMIHKKLPHLTEAQTIRLADFFARGLWEVGFRLKPVQEVFLKKSNRKSRQNHKSK